MKNLEKLENLNLEKMKYNPYWKDLHEFTWELMGARKRNWTKYDPKVLKL